MKLLLLPFALLLAVSAQPAFAGEGEGHKCPMHDASLSDADRAAAMDKMFAKMDADADGNISRAEFDKHHADMKSEHEGHAKHEAAEGHDGHAGHEGH
jgi:hypothetical protein